MTVRVSVSWECVIADRDAWPADPPDGWDAAALAADLVAAYATAAEACEDIAPAGTPGLRMRVQHVPDRGGDGSEATVVWPL